jgi:thioredoxin 1
MSKEVTVTGDNFAQEVLEAEVPVLADFWAEWCVPCKMMGPILAELADELDGKVKVAKINVDDAGELATHYNIVSIPTLVLFQKGEMVKQQIGAVPRKVLDQMLAEYL